MAPETVVTGGDSSTTGEVVTISATELADLQSRAGASSQNFERLKKANETIEEYEARIAELDAIIASRDSGGVVTDPRVVTLEQTVKGLSEELAMGKVLETFPVIRGKEADFNEFRNLPENQGMSLAVAAKAFVVEKDLITPRRPGLEAPTGGGHAPAPSGKLSAEDAGKLRNTNYKAYVAGLKNGTIQIE